MCVDDKYLSYPTPTNLHPHPFLHRQSNVAQARVCDTLTRCGVVEATLSLILFVIEYHVHLYVSVWCVIL